MKSNARKSVYFSAYPLKAITERTAGSAESPYLKGILTAKTKSLSRTRVFPMVNPYQKQKSVFRPRVTIVTGDMEFISKEWFNNYE